MTGQNRCDACGQALPSGTSFCLHCGSPARTQLSWGPDDSGGTHEIEVKSLRNLLQRSLGQQFEVQEALGEGGFGVVFKAKDFRLERSVAVKVLRRELLLSEGFVERFQREAQALAALRHPGIIPVYSIGESDQLVWIVMPFIEGETLGARLGKTPELGPAEAVRILRGIGEALEAAHATGLVHRDIKPENVMLEGSEQRVLLMDFGIAKAVRGARGSVTSTGMVLGTPLYMSPEQASGDPSVDHRSDIYSLGVLAFQLFTGRLPFVGESGAELMRQHVLRAAPDPRSVNPNLPEATGRAVLRALAKSPSDRFATVRDFLSALEPPTTPWPPSRQRVPHASRLALTGVVVGIGCLAAVFATRPLQSVRVKATVKATDMRFGLEPGQSPWAAALPLRSIGVAGLDHFTMPNAAGHSPTRVDEGSLYLATAASDSAFGSITLEPVTFGRAVALEVAPTGVAGGALLSLGDSIPPITAAVDGPIELTIPGQPPETLTFTLQRFELTPGSGGLELELARLKDGEELALGSVAIRMLALERIERLREGDIASDLQKSTVVAASVVLPDLDRPARELAAGDPLDLDDFTGFARNIVVDTTAVTFTADGAVTALPAALGRIPTRIERWWSLEPLVVASVAVLYALSIFVVFRTWRNE